MKKFYWSQLQDCFIITFQHHKIYKVNKEEVPKKLKCSTQEDDL